MNGLIEAAIYGNVNATHIRGKSIMNGTDGSGDFAPNAYIAIFMTHLAAKGGRISCIVPMATSVDHAERDVQVIVTEEGLAELNDCHLQDQRH
jgi:succinyl-CoA:acetate CoA-transferase